MAEEQLQAFLEKVRQLNACVAQSETCPELREALAACAKALATVSPSEISHASDDWLLFQPFCFR